MIRYALICDNGHDFESWFRSSDDFDMQQQRRLVECPVCASTTVGKQIMAPTIARTDRTMVTDQTTEPVALIDPDHEAMRRKLADLHRELTQNSDDVGVQFAEEARRIHYGESTPRLIHGRATGEEARAMIEEGIPVLPLPPLPDERN